MIKKMVRSGIKREKCFRNGVGTKRKKVVQNGTKRVQNGTKRVEKDEKVLGNIHSGGRQLNSPLGYHASDSSSNPRGGSKVLEYFYYLFSITYSDLF